MEEEKEELYIRKSNVEEYEFCPHRAEHTLNTGEYKKSNYIMSVGTRFHQFANKFFDYCDAVPIYEWELMVPEEFNVFEKRMAIWFVQEERNRYYRLELEDRLDEFRPIARELGMRHEGLKIRTDGVDRVDWNNKAENTVTVIEYKTGSSFYAPALKRQLAFYTILWQETIGLGNVTKLKVINPKLQKCEEYALTELALNKTIQSIIDLRHAINNNGPWPRKCTTRKYAACRFCTPDELVGVLYK